MFNTVFMGLPGSGKGTQAQILAKQYGWIHIEPGRVFREQKQENTPLSEKIQKAVNAGCLLSDEIVMEMMKKKMGEYIQQNKGFIFDGIPRTLGQAKYLDKVLKERNTKVHLVFLLETDEATVKQRILNRSRIDHRLDDQDMSKIDKRIALYHQNISSLKTFYEQKNILKRIHAKRAVEDITDQIIKSLKGSM